MGKFLASKSTKRERERKREMLQSQEGHRGRGNQAKRARHDEEKSLNYEANDVGVQRRSYKEAHEITAFYAFTSLSLSFREGW